MEPALFGGVRYHSTIAAPPVQVPPGLAGILRVVSLGDGRPVRGVYEIFEQSAADLKVQTDRLQHVLATDLPAFNAEATRMKLQPVK